MTHHSWGRDGYIIHTDPARLDLDAIHKFLKSAYWSRGVPRRVVERAIEGSINFGLYGPSDNLMGYARVVSDRATIAYLTDLLVLEDARGRGLATWLMECILAHPELQGLRRWALATADAHGLYAKFGFAPALDGHVMLRSDLDIYLRRAPGRACREKLKSGRGPGSGKTQLRVQPAGGVQRMQLVAAADMFVGDKDLRHRAAALGAGHHFPAAPGAQHDIELGEFDALRFQETLGGITISAQHAGIDLDFGHLCRLVGVCNPGNIGPKSANSSDKCPVLTEV